MFRITREQFIAAAQKEIERVKAINHHPDEDQAVKDWSMTRVTEIQFAIKHLYESDGTTWLEPTEMRALMEILYG